MVLVALGGLGWILLSISLHNSSLPVICMPDSLQNKHPSLATSKPLRLSTIVLPPPSQIFQSRKNILDKMHHFFNMGIQHIYVLHGLGGAGKTQIGLKFINESSSCAIVTIETGLKNIAIAKGFGDSLQDGLL
ncbi:hypothetical protein DFH08DRAFT_826830 [Mycena albidolilacea]|uniref:NB-ARC domain-containing protein n=1 Tax=Mycena albidolilacea TaxID=1033008 RepID=A0AAD7E7X3_9AGAR|nr:hypothetical protein DFH08DRAFT_826830 [Mycena albidolilacea]